MALRLLTIENFILIDQASIELDSGLCVLTGETGAGKSIILDALGLILGDKGGMHLLQDKQRAAIITAALEIKFRDNPKLLNIIEDFGLYIPEDSDFLELIIKRVINPDGRTRAFLNHSLINITQLEQLGSSILEVCGQHKNQQLLNQKEHLNILDVFANNANDLEKTANYFDLLQKKHKELDNAIKLQNESEIEKTYLQHVIDEIELFQPLLNEEEILTEKRKLLSSQSKILATLSDTIALLDHNNVSIIPGLYAIEKLLSKFPEYFNTLLSKFEVIRIDLEELKNILESKTSEFSVEGDLESIEGRLFDLKNLARKYKVSPQELSNLLVETKAQLEMTRDIGNVIANLKVELGELKTEYMQLANKISDSRKNAAVILRDKMLQEFRDLNLERSDILIAVDELDYEQRKRNGINNVTFMIKTNPNSDFGPLNKIASGGELSRFMLACKIVMSDIKDVSAMIFDEIDTGIGGRVATNIGKKLRELSSAKQVIIVTHQPQVAVYAHHHYLVEKKYDADFTKIQINKLNTSQKETEVARMISGDEITKEAIAATQKLFNLSSA